MERISQWQSTPILLAILLHFSSAYAQSGDGGGAEGFSNSNLGAAGTGADGSASSSANLSKGAIIAIAVVVAVVVFGGATLSILFFVAKKRQWKIRQSIRRTASRVSTAVKAMTPRTPARMSFGPRSPRPPKAGGGGHLFMRKNTPMKQTENRDLEKGFGSIDQTLQRSSEDSQNSKLDNPKQPLHVKKDSMNKQIHKPKPIITTPQSHFDIDSPKSPMWQRVFGRK